ncbi:hypothetical protein LINGRAHAP2_LOCUS35097, partial [Linum grandiflorum]
VIFCTVCDDRWTIPKEDLHITTVVFVEGKIYGNTIDDYPKFVEIEIRPNYIMSRKLFDLPPFNYYPGCLNFIEKFVESCGELLYFNLQFYGNVDGDHITADIKVYEIDVKNARSKELEDFGDIAFFFSHDLDCGFGCCASKFGLKENTIYYINASSNKFIKV